jgi:hypothetical protein
MSRPRALKDDPEAQEAAAAFKAIDTKKAIDANDAIAILERRVKNATAEIDLGDGDMIKVRTRLSKAEAARLEKAYAGIAETMAKTQREVTNEAGETVIEKIRDPTPEESAAVEDLSNRLFSMILYDPARTPDEIYDWLAANPDAFSPLDQGAVFLGYREIANNEGKKREDLRNFRAQ